MRRALLRHGFMAVAACTVLGACQSSGPKAPATSAVFLTYKVMLLVEKDSNVGSDGKELPLKLKVFKLRSPTEFMSADFFALQSGNATLQGSVVAQEQLFLRPGQREASLSFERSAEISHLGVLAEYQQLDGKIWRRAVALPEPAPVSKPFYRFLLPEKPAIQTVAIAIRATPQGLVESVGAARAP